VESGDICIFNIEVNQSVQVIEQAKGEVQGKEVESYKLKAKKALSTITNKAERERDPKYKVSLLGSPRHSPQQDS
jgi:hypothetical protein